MRSGGYGYWLDSRQGTNLSTWNGRQDCTQFAQRWGGGDLHCSVFFLLLDFVFLVFCSGNQDLDYRSVASSHLIMVCFLLSGLSLLFVFIIESDNFFPRKWKWKHHLFHLIVFQSIFATLSAADHRCKWQFQSGHSLCGSKHSPSLSIAGSIVLEIREGMSWSHNYAHRSIQNDCRSGDPKQITALLPKQVLNCTE